MGLAGARDEAVGIGLSDGINAAPPGSRPSKISDLASAMASQEPKNSRCAGAMAVTRATCGRTKPTRIRSSPKWFMPTSNTPYFASRGRAARLSGTPQWLL